MGYADRDKYGMYRNRGKAGPGPALMGADTLIGDGVVNAAEEDLGDIKEIMLDMNTGQVAYAVPWQALHLDTVNHRFVLNVEKERLKAAPGFNKDAWPDMADIDWATEIHSFYGTDPNQGGAPTIGAGSGKQRGGMGNTEGAVHGSGASVDPRPGNLGGDKDISRIRGSNIG